MKVFWEIKNSGLYPHERCTILEIRGMGCKPRTYKNPTDASLQRIIKLSKGRIYAEVSDDILTVSGVINVADKAAISDVAIRRSIGADLTDGAE